MSNLQNLLTGENVRTLLLILVTLIGGGNLMETSRLDSYTSTEVERAIQAFHREFEPALARQKEMAEAIKKILDQQQKPAQPFER